VFEQKGGKHELAHQPVLYHESLKYLQAGSTGLFVDGTVGAGGHAFGILSNSNQKTKLLGLDLDPQAITIAKKRLAQFGNRVILRQESYATINKIINELGWGCVNGIILDLGVSSMQFDRAERGFSFSKTAALDMRFNPRANQTAADLLNSLDEKEIADIIWKFGEEPRSRKIARIIVQERPISTTTQLAEIVQKAYGKKQLKTNPATRTFQAIRIAVNHELEVLELGLRNALASLCKGGRLVVITFHSLEDRKVKQLFKTESQGCICPPEQIICNCEHTAIVKIITRKPVIPSEEEVNTNPRARSAKMRVVEKI